MDLCDGYKVQVQDYEGYRFIAIRRFYTVVGERKAGIPGFNLNFHQWEKLKKLRQQLVHSAVMRHNVVAKLGFEKVVEVKRGVIWLKRVPEDCSEEFLKRNSVALTPRLWRELWKNGNWIASELREKSPESEYELEPVDIKLEPGADAADTRAVDTPDSPAQEEKTLLIDQSDSATALHSPCSASNLIPQQDSDLSCDPIWYQFRAASTMQGGTSSGSGANNNNNNDNNDNGSRSSSINHGKRKPPLTLRRQEAIKLSKLSFD